MTTDVFEHREEAWKIERNPFPAEATRIRNKEQPSSEGAFPKQTNEFRRMLIRGGVPGGQAIGFLWSQGARADTGFGKTTVMQEITGEPNKDLGATTLEKAGAKKGSPPISAAFSNLNNLNATGLYPVLFNAVVDLATPAHSNTRSVFDTARAPIIQELGSDDSEGIAERVQDAWTEIGGTSGPPRSELVEAFAAGGHESRFLSRA